jgi:predicted metal-binding membrane protein
MGHLLGYATFRGVTRDFRAGFEHGFFCAACCWGLMAVLVAVGVMNVPAMVVLASVVAAEKLWSHGAWMSRGIGTAALVAAVAVIWVPGLAPGLTNELDGMRAMEAMSEPGGISGGGGMGIE